jgi:hypothetical protein
LRFSRSFPEWFFAPDSDMVLPDAVSGRADLIDNGSGEGDQAEIKAQDDAALLVSDGPLFFCITKQRKNKSLTLTISGPWAISRYVEFL